MNRSRIFLASLLLCTGGAGTLASGDPTGRFEKEVKGVLEDHCFDCHADGKKKGDVAFDAFASTAELMSQQDLWVKVLRNVRAGLMPPAKEERVPQAELRKLEDWIKFDALGLNATNPDPGRVTLRRLNRVEYRNTIRDLMGVDFRADAEFPADDSGYGFDNIGDVLSTSPLLLEKYMAAAEAIVAEAVPLVSRVVPERFVPVREFLGVRGEPNKKGDLVLSLYDATELSHRFSVDKAGTYRLSVLATLYGSFDRDPARAIVSYQVDGVERWSRELVWNTREGLPITSEDRWEPGEHEARFIIKPLVTRDSRPKARQGEGEVFLNVDFSGMRIAGPSEPEFKVASSGYGRFFSRADAPGEKAEWPVYAREVLRTFTERAFRRPVDDATVEKLAAIAGRAWDKKDATFEPGVARAMTAVLASPRFLFRVEDTLPADSGVHPLLDEYSLASRLSYFLWSTMPDAELTSLARQGALRANLTAQTRRMLADPRSEEFVRNFAGQWLQLRDVESVSIDARVVQARDSGTERDMQGRFAAFRKLNEDIDAATRAGDEERAKALRKELGEMRAQFRGKRIEFSADLRTAMRREAEMLFRYILQEDRSVVELIDADYSFLNEALAKHYGIQDVTGADMKRVNLPSDSVRGGVLTMGAALAVTSNPTRTSPVKRGLFILENILGTPTPPPPPDVPSLEVSEKGADGTERSLREALAMHREKPLCSSCHNRMDPLGLAFENFNAMGLWRDTERGKPIPSVAGQLITGEKFADVRELKHLLAHERRLDFERCLSEKLLTYALGRGTETCDILALDDIVAKLEREDGKLTALVMGIVESAPFQRRRAK